MNILKTKLEEIDNQIRNLQMEKVQIEQEIIESSSSLEEKFYAWAGSSMGKIESWYPSYDEYPLLNKYIDGCEFNRYSTVDLVDYLDEDFYYAFQASEEELEEDWNKKHYTEEKRQEIRGVAEEMMVKNIKGFKCDW